MREPPGLGPWKSHKFTEEQWERELRFAARVQTSVLEAQSTVVPGAAAHGCSISHYAIGGDYFDFLVQPDGTMRVIVADVMGKGVSAALLITMFRGAVRVASAQANSPGKLLQMMNDLFYVDLQRVQAFITVACADFHPASGTVTLTCAGAPSPLLVRGSDGKIEEVKSRGIALGIRDNPTYVEHRVPCADGDLLVLFTDGIVDVQGEDGKSLGMSGVENLLTVNRRRGARGFFDSVFQGVADYSRGTGVRDDVTLVATYFGESAAWTDQRPSVRSFGIDHG